jgi:type II secretory pathway pseudopilin PulG
MVLAVLAVVAGVMAPYAVQQIEASRKESTLRELSAIEDGLLGYYRDCSQLPDDSIGLVALARNAAKLPNWNGPYVGGTGNVEDGITKDAWGGTYTYVRNPQIKGSSATVDYLVLSAGRDRQLDSKPTGGKWTLDTNGDLVLQGLTHAVDESWEVETRAKLAEIEDGLTGYYRDVGSFPSGNDSTALVELVSSGVGGWRGPYVRETLTSIARDPWKARVVLRACTEVNSETVSGWILLSYGPGPPDAKVKGQRWRTGSNDIFRVITSGRLKAMLDVKRQEETRRQLKLLAAQIFTNNPTQSPGSGSFTDLDPWGRNYQYIKKSANSGVAYSVGANGVNESAGGDDLYEALLWPL